MKDVPEASPVLYRFRVGRPDDLRKPEQRSRYDEHLKETIFPLVEELRERGLVTNAHFLTHPVQAPNEPTPKEADLCLYVRVPDERSLADVKQVLAANGLASEAEAADPAEEGELREVFLSGLSSVCDLVASVLNHSDPTKFHREVIHYLNNGLGMTNVEEAALHIGEALGWLTTVNMQPGVRFTDAQRQAVQQLEQYLKTLSEPLPMDNSAAANR
jgi:hypothetical protein